MNMTDYTPFLQYIGRITPEIYKLQTKCLIDLSELCTSREKLVENRKKSLHDTDSSTTNTLNKQTWTIGRSPHSDIRLKYQDSVFVSRRHAQISCIPREKGNPIIYLKDLTSLNGTFVNFCSIRGDTVKLQHGDIIHFGGAADIEQSSTPVFGVKLVTPFVYVYCEDSFEQIHTRQLPSVPLSVSSNQEIQNYRSSLNIAKQRRSRSNKTLRHDNTLVKLKESATKRQRQTVQESDLHNSDSHNLDLKNVDIKSIESRSTSGPLESVATSKSSVAIEASPLADSHDMRFQQLTKMIQCPQCHQTMYRPHSLTCGHSTCVDCAMLLTFPISRDELDSHIKHFKDVKYEKSIQLLQSFCSGSDKTLKFVYSLQQELSDDTSKFESNQMFTSMETLQCPVCYVPTVPPNILVVPDAIYQSCCTSVPTTTTQKSTESKPLQETLAKLPIVPFSIIARPNISLQTIISTVQTEDKMKKMNLPSQGIATLLGTSENIAKNTNSTFFESIVTLKQSQIQSNVAHVQTPAKSDDHVNFSFSAFSDKTAQSKSAFSSLYRSTNSKRRNIDKRNQEFTATGSPQQERMVRIGADGYDTDATVDD